MCEDLEATVVPYRNNEETIGDLQDIKNPTDKENDEIEESVDAEDIFEESSGNTEYIYV